MCTMNAVATTGTSRLTKGIVEKKATITPALNSFAE